MGTKLMIRGDNPILGEGSGRRVGRWMERGRISSLAHGYEAVGDPKRIEFRDAMHAKPQRKVSTLD